MKDRLPTKYKSHKPQKPHKELRKSGYKIQNLYETAGVKKFIEKVKNPTEKDTGIPYGSRLLIVGGSGAGKTNWLGNLIMKSPKTYKHIVIVNKDIDEPVYKALKDKLEGTGQVDFMTLETMPELNDLTGRKKEKEDQWLVIFDDLGTDVEAASKKIRQKFTNYFIAGRKCNLTMCWLAQSFFDTLKTIRRQMTHIALLRLQDRKDLNMILQRNNLGLTLPQLEYMHECCTEEPFQAMLVDTLATKPEKKYHRNFSDEFIFTRTPSGTLSVRPGAWYRPCHSESDSDSSDTSSSSDSDTDSDDSSDY